MLASGTASFTDQSILQPMSFPVAKRRPPRLSLRFSACKGVRAVAPFRFMTAAMHRPRFRKTRREIVRAESRAADLVERSRQAGIRPAASAKSPYLIKWKAREKSQKTMKFVELAELDEASSHSGNAHYFIVVDACGSYRTHGTVIYR